ncbi:MAG: hypothetical protein ACP5G1_04635, partial [Nanopusillaceae archaeon]
DEAFGKIFTDEIEKRVYIWLSEENIASDNKKEEEKNYNRVSLEKLIDMNREKWEEAVLKKASNEDLKRLLESYNSETLSKNTLDNSYQYFFKVD